MLSIIIATDGREPPAVATLAVLVPGAAAGLVREVLMVDPGSDAIARVADVAGCNYVAVAGGRAAALAAGAAKARSPWLLLLHAGAVLDPTWIDETAQFIQTVAAAGPQRAGLFRHARSPYTRMNWRDRVTALLRLAGRPSPAPGLLIARAHFEQLSGYDLQARNPEAGLLRKLGRARMPLRTRIVTT